MRRIEGESSIQSALPLSMKSRKQRRTVLSCSQSHLNTFSETRTHHGSLISSTDISICSPPHMHIRAYLQRRKRKEPSFAHRKDSYWKYVQSLLPWLMILDRRKQNVDHEQSLNSQPIERNLSVGARAAFLSLDDH